LTATFPQCWQDPRQRATLKSGQQEGQQFVGEQSGMDSPCAAATIRYFLLNISTEEQQNIFERNYFLYQMSQ